MLCFNLFPGQNLNKFTLNKDETLIFGFFDEYFRVFKNSQPFHRLYSFSYNDIDYLAKFKNYFKAEEKCDESNINGNYIYNKNSKDDYLIEYGKQAKANERNKHSKATKKALKENTENENKKAQKSNKRVKTKAEKTCSKYATKFTNGNAAAAIAEKKAQKNKTQTLNRKGRKIIELSSSSLEDKDDDEDEDAEKEELVIENLDSNSSNDYLDSDEAQELLESEGDLQEMLDFIDFNEKMEIQDNNFILNHVQKGLVSLDKKFVLFCFFYNGTKKFYLVKFHLHYFTKKMTDYDFFKKCYNGQMPDLCQIVMSSQENIFFNFPPALYLKNLIFSDPEGGLDISKLLKSKLDNDYIERNIYCPLAVINKEFLYFIELNQNFESAEKFDFGNQQKTNTNKDCCYEDKLLDKYPFSFKDRICYEGLSFKWLYNNTLLITAEDKFMRMIKFTFDQFVLGILIKKDYEA